MEEDYISVYEYEKNVNPNLQSTPFYEKDINTCNYGINIVDFSNIYKSSHKSTTPNLLASFIKLEKSDNIELNNNNAGLFVINALLLALLHNVTCKMTHKDGIN